MLKQNAVLAKFLKLLLTSIMLVLILAPATSAFAASVEGLRLWRAPDSTRLVFDLSGPVDHKLFTLANPDRLVIDIDSTRFSASLDELDLLNTPIKKIRYSARNQGDLRVVLDLKELVKPRSFALAKQAGKQDRLVIDLYDSEKDTVKTVTTIAQNTSGQRDVIIAIDAGHGGEDPGALGPNRIKEKDIVLSISKELKRIIDAQPGYQAQLVRTGDYYMAHKARRDTARKAQADLFISVHADGFKDARARGAGVFALSQRGATSETARYLAQKENEADLVGGVIINDKDDAVAELILDLSMKSNLANSLEVGDRVLGHMGKVAHLHKREVEQAAFLVLKSPDVPSILVETGFISNPEEARKLRTSAYQLKLAHAIFLGVQDHFEAAPPAGTWLAWRQKNEGKTIKYVIARGDTLSGIASRYNVSVQKIMQVNQLNGTSIRIGQTLTIPTS